MEKLSLQKIKDKLQKLKEEQAAFQAEKAAPVEGISPKPAQIKQAPVETAKPVEPATDLGTLVAPGAEGKTAYSIYEFKALDANGKPKIGLIKALDQTGALQHLNREGLYDPNPGSGKPWIKLDTVKVNLPSKPTASQEAINFPPWWNTAPDFIKKFAMEWWLNSGETPEFDHVVRGGVPVVRFPKGGGYFRIYRINYGGEGKHLMEYRDEDDPKAETKSKLIDNGGNEIDKPESKTSESTAAATSLENLEIEAVELREVENILVEFLEGQKNVDNVDHIEIVAAENNELILDAELTAKKLIIIKTIKTDVTLKGRLVNQGDSISIKKGYSLTATKNEDTVKEIFAEKINSVAEEIKKGIEKSRKRKVMMMTIMSGKLIVGFEKPKAKPVGAPTKKIPAPVLDSGKTVRINLKPENIVSRERLPTKAQAIENLREIVRKATDALEANKLAREEDAVLIKNLRTQLAEAKAREEKEGLERERKEKLEKDREKNPFKWHLVDMMKDAAFNIVFSGRKKEEISLQEINYKFGEDGTKGANSSWWFYKISKGYGNTSNFSPNGFTLELINKEEVLGKDNDNDTDGTKRKDPRARYKLANPNWEYVNETKEGVTYEKGMELLTAKAAEYQAEQRKKFE